MAECIAQIFFDLAAAFGLGMQIARIEPELAAPAALGGIEGQIRALRTSIIGIEPVIGRNGNADRRANDAATARNRIGLGDHLDDLLGNITKPAAVVDIGQDDLEFVATKPADFAICRA